MAFNEYQKKLLDGRWQRKRLEILERDGFCCTICHAQNNVQVHHNWYLKGYEPWDYDGEHLVTLCNDHHEEISKIQNELKQLLARSGPDVQRKVYNYLTELLREPELSQTKPELSAYNQITEPSRIERLKNVCRYLEHFPGVYSQISKLHDHKGELTCTWKTNHNCDNWFEIVECAWKEQGECCYGHEYE